MLLDSITKIKAQWYFQLRFSVSIIIPLPILSVSPQSLLPWGSWSSPQLQNSLQISPTKDHDHDAEHDADHHLMLHLWWRGHNHQSFRSLTHTKSQCLQAQNSLIQTAEDEGSHFSCQKHSIRSMNHRVGWRSHCGMIIGFQQLRQTGRHPQRMADSLIDQIQCSKQLQSNAVFLMDFIMNWDGDSISEGIHNPGFGPSVFLSNVTAGVRC